MTDPKYRATIRIPDAAYESIAATLLAMGHDHCFMEEGGIVPFAMRLVPTSFEADTKGVA